jgi:Na+-driven multidrug efflux pump
VLVIPVALGCLLYPDIGVALYSRAAFRPAEDNLRVLSLYLLLLYFSMPLAASVMAAGRQRVWAGVQAACVLVSLVLDPVLVPWFQMRMGNGGVGLSIAAVVSELIVVTCGVWLAPSGILGRRFWGSMLPALGSGVAMFAVAYLLRGLPSLAAAPVAILGYLGCLWATGGVDREFVAAARALVARKLAR